MNSKTVNSHSSATAADSIWAIPLVRHLSIVLVVKLSLLFLIWFLFFRHPEGAPEPGSDVHDHIAGPRTAMVSPQHD